jgi:tetratricopeptide (TPR) repeat protein
MAGVSRASHAGRSAALALAAALVVAGLTSAARAQGQGGDAAEKRRQASEHVKQGDQHKDAGAYDDAAREYQAAYELVPHPVLFFNLAQVYRLKGDREQALEYYERYLAGDPDGRASAQARRFASELRAAIEHDRAAARQRERQSRARQRPAPPAPGAVLGPGGQPVDDGEPSPGRGLRVGGMVMGAVGVVSVGVGVGFGLRARSISNEIDDHTAGPWPDELLDRQAQGEESEQYMFVFTSAGVAAIAAGGLLYYMGHRARGRESRGVALTPVAAGDQVGLALSGAF